MTPTAPSLPDPPVEYVTEIPCQTTKFEISNAGKQAIRDSLQATFVPGTSSLDDVGIFASSGGTFNAPGTVTTTQVGTASLDFSSCSAATLSYTFTTGANNGQHGTIALVRTTPAPAGCSP